MSFAEVEGNSDPRLDECPSTEMTDAEADDFTLQKLEIAQDFINDMAGEL